jgi:hypothetical protein
MHFSALFEADIYRDGGSLEAVFQAEPARICAVCLKADIRRLGGLGSKYTELFYFADETDPCRPFMNQLASAQVIDLGSSEEKELLSALSEFLAAPTLLPLRYPSIGADRRLDIVRSLLREIPSRRSKNSTKQKPNQSPHPTTL